MRVPKKPSGRKALPFYWYRRFRAHKPLPYKARLLDKIENGDFEYSEFFQQADWELHWMKDEQKEFIQNYKGFDNPENDTLYMDIEIKARKRWSKLIEDGMKDEQNRMDKLVNGLYRLFKVSKDIIREEMNEFDGTTKEFYYHIAKL